MLYFNQWEIFKSTSCCIKFVVNLLRTTLDKGAANRRYFLSCPSPETVTPELLVSVPGLPVDRQAHRWGYHANTHPGLWATKITCSRWDTFCFEPWVLFQFQQPWQHQGRWEKTKWDAFRFVRFSSMSCPMLQGWAGALGPLWAPGYVVVPSRD